MTPLFSELLGRYLNNTHTSVNRLSKLTGIPQRTIANWLEGQTLKPHRWQDIIKIAVALHLSLPETNAMLKATGYAPIENLNQQSNSQEVKRFLLQLSQGTQPIPHPPFQEITWIPTFIGRETEINYARKALLESKRLVLYGDGRVGKTALAVQLAYQIRGEFPDGVLWARLDTLDVLTILSAFATSYGKDVNQYKDMESRSAVVRNILAEKRVLIIFDNAKANEQFSLLLPPNTGNSAVLITTRHKLSVLNRWEQITLTQLQDSRK